MEKLVTFSFDNLSIVSAAKDNVILEGRSDLYEPCDCLIVMDREDFKKSMDKWLDEKRNYYDRFSYFCGCGYVDCKVIKDLEIDEFSTKDNKIDVYLCEFDTVHMEHG